jgi:N-acetylglucosamine kinase
MQVLGLDAGGTKTVCCLANDRGDILAESRGPGAHLTSAGPRSVETTLRQVIDDVLAKQSTDVAAACLGMAGVDRPSEEAVVRGILQRIISIPHIAIVNDALIALEAGAPGVAGIVVISGTGSIAYGRDDRGRAARSGGWGYVLADEGSGYWLGRQALRAAMREADGRGPRTLLTAKLLTQYQVARATELPRKVYASDLKPASIARLASIVQTAADEHDEVAMETIDRGASELTSAAVSVARQLDLSSCPVVLSGGIFHAVPTMLSRFKMHLSSRLPDAHAELLESEPAMGAVRLALRAAHDELVIPEYVDR